MTAPAPTRAEEGWERREALKAAFDWLQVYGLDVSNPRDGNHPKLDTLAREFESFGRHASARAEAEVARLTAALAEAERERAVLAELVSEYASEKAPDALEAACLDRDRWLRSAAAAEASALALRERVAVLEVENQRLRIAFHDATRRPLGVTPDSGAEFYDQQMADEAEERRAGAYIQEVISRVGRAEAAARTALEISHADN